MSVMWPESYGEAATSLSYIPADPTLVQAGHDLGEQAECQLGTGLNVPAGTTNYGFVDTTYGLTKAQILAESTIGTP